MMRMLCTLCVAAIDSTKFGRSTVRVTFSGHPEAPDRIHQDSRLVEVLATLDMGEWPDVEVAINAEAGFSLIGQAILQGNSTCIGHLVQIGHVAIGPPRRAGDVIRWPGYGR